MKTFLPLQPALVVGMAALVGVSAGPARASSTVMSLVFSAAVLLVLSAARARPESRGPILMSAFFALLAGGASFLILDQPVFAYGPWFFWLPGALLLVHAHLSLWRPKNLKPSARPAARAFLLLHLGESVALQPEMAGPGVLFYVFFEAILKIRPYVLT